MMRLDLLLAVAGLVVTGCNSGDNELTTIDLGQPDSGSIPLDGGPDLGPDLGPDAGEADFGPDAGEVDQGADEDGGADSGADAAEAECWREIQSFGDQGNLDEFGATVLSVGNTAFAAAILEAGATGGPSWRLFRFSQDVMGRWNIDRSVTGSDVGSVGTVVDALIENQGRLWIGIRGGEVLSVSLDLDDPSPLVQAPSAGASFGRALAANSTTLFIGDPGAGSVDVFDIVSSTPRFRRTLTSSTSGTAGFGTSLALKDDRLLVGAPSGCQGLSCGAGAVVEYRRQGQQWQLHQVKASSNARFQLYGDSIAWAGDDAVVSAPRSYHCVPECYRAPAMNAPEPGTAGCAADLTPCLFVGAASIETTSTAVEVFPSALGINGIYNQQFGKAVAANDRWIAVGSPLDRSCLIDDARSIDCTSAGAVHVFEKGLGTLTPTKYLKPTDIVINAYFGSSMSLGDEHLVVGAPGHCGSPIGQPCTRSGAVYFFSTCPKSD